MIKNVRKRFIKRESQFVMLINYANLINGYCISCIQKSAAKNRQAVH